MIKTLKCNRSIVNLEFSESYYFPPMGLGGSDTIETDPKLTHIIRRLLAYNQSLLPKTENSINPFFTSKLSIKQELKEHLDLLETEWQYIGKNEATSIYLRALKYLQYSLELNINSEKMAIIDMFDRFPEVLRPEPNNRVAKFCDKLARAMSQLDNAGASLSKSTLN